MGGGFVTVGAKPVGVAIVGCGAVAQIYYRPALAALVADGSVSMVGAHDPDPSALERFCDGLPGTRPVATFDGLLALRPQLLIVASPPQHHASQSIEALRAGIDVFCEKPLATCLADGTAMVEAAATAGRRLSVGLVRRRFPATDTIRRLLRSGALGELQSIEGFEGGPFTWPVRSAQYFAKEAGNAGVLQDIGTHALDLLLWWLGEPTSVAYEDDALGGVEANCRVDLRFGDVAATLRLSRDWARPNRYRITGADGWISWDPIAASHYEFGFTGSSVAVECALHDVVSGPDGPELGPAAMTFEDAFAEQLRRAIADDAESDRVTGEESLATLALIDRCYSSRSAMSMPWMVPVGKTSDD
jgi:predicted dehydrogenase